MPHETIGIIVKRDGREVGLQAICLTCKWRGDEHGETDSMDNMQAMVAMYREREDHEKG